MASFKLPCPSCENPVPIKDEKLVGTKVECPKCKYRFKVEAPARDAKDADAAGKGKDKGKDKKKAVAASSGKKKKSSKKAVAIVVGLLAVGVLGVVGFAMMGGDDKPKGGGFVPGPVNTGPVANNDGTNPDGTNPDGTNPDGTDPLAKKDDEKDKEKPKDKTPPAVPSALASEQETTNLFPNETVSLFRFDIDAIRRTPVSVLFDRTALDLFRRSFGIDPDNVAVYYHAIVGEKREPFGVIRLRTPVHENAVLSAMGRVGEPKEIKKRKLYVFKSNPFTTAVSSAFHFDALFGDLYVKVPAGPVPASQEPRVIGVSLYDTQHILVGDHSQLQAFLAGLDGKGLPKLLSGTGNPPAGVTLADKPVYLSIDPKLKRALQDVGSEMTTVPPVVFAEKVIQGFYDPKLLKPDLQSVSAVLDPVLSRMQYLSAALYTLSTGQLTAKARMQMTSNTAAFESVRDQLVPALTLAAWGVSDFLNTPVLFRNHTTAGGMPPMGGDPNNPGAIDPMAMPMIMPMGMPGGGEDPGGEQPLTPNKPKGPQLSYIDLGLTDQVITLNVDWHWSSEVYRNKIEPRIIGIANTIKGKMAVFATDQENHVLAGALPRITANDGAFPRGTADRRLADASRRGLRYPPQTRVSFFAELLPFLGRDNLTRGINRDAAWYDDVNLPAAEAWVPELLVPDYPQSAWRATSPLVADGRVMGGTNYVGIAGVGLDSPRFDPKNPAYATKVGITGYDWGSKPEEVKDGLSNTIYLMQTPPGLSQPWIAGGGATIRGLNEAEPMRGFTHTIGTPNGKPGTYALMGDGSVRFVPANINPKVLLAMGTRAGMEDLADLNTAAPRVDPPKKKPEPKPEPAPVDTVFSGAVEVAPAPREKK